MSQQPVVGDNLVALLLAHGTEPEAVAATHPVGGRFQDITWGEIIKQVKHVSEGLVALGVKPGDRVALFAATSLRWVVCDLAISAAQAVVVPVYSSNTPDELRHIVVDSESTVLFVDHDEMEGKQTGRVGRARSRYADMPSLRQVILWDGAAKEPKEVSWADFEARAQEAHGKNPKGGDERAALVKGSDLNCLIYTSGTTGAPKGVMLDHASWIFVGDGIAKANVLRPGESVMLFLPLAHVFAQDILAAWLRLGYRLILAESVDRLMPNLLDTHPTILPAVPRVFEKVFNSVVSTGMAAPGLKGKLFRMAMAEFDAYVAAKQKGHEYQSLKLTVAKALVFSKVKKTLDERMGGRMRLFISGGAPLSAKIAYFFQFLGFLVLEGYGLTETAGSITVNLPQLVKVGTVGRALPGAEVKIASDGEILLKGPSILKGYYKNEAATAEVLEQDGWFHSGDIGEVDKDGYVRITDRKKDIIVTAGGKNVAPQNLENQLKTYPIVSQAMVYGDKRKYLTSLITVNEEVAKRLLADAGVPAVASYAELSKRPEIQKAVQGAIDAVNSVEPAYSSIKKFVIMEHDFTQESGDLTPTLKVKRKMCTQRYRPILDKLYDEPLYD
jgi:long-chain acyl-CoA synthetase